MFIFSLITLWLSLSGFALGYGISLYLQNLCMSDGTTSALCEYETEVNVAQLVVTWLVVFSAGGCVVLWKYMQIAWKRVY